MKTNFPGVLRLGSIVSIFAGLAVCAVAGDPEFYATTSGGYFGTLDPISGEFAAIGQTNGAVGMGFAANGNLYGFGWGATSQVVASQLFLVNLSTGVPVGVGGQIFSFPNTVWGMAATADGTLYSYTASGRVETLLQTVNPANGIEGTVGGMGVHLAGAFAGDELGGLFITAGSAPEKLYSVNPSTGAATLIGPTGTGVAVAMAFDKNTLYLVGAGGDIWNVNSATGAASKISNYSGQSAYGTILSMASQPKVADPAPRFQSIVSTNGAVTLAWSAVAGRAYQVQYNSDLSPGNWLNLSSAVMANGTNLTIIDPAASNATRFYRVALLPQ